MGRAKKVKYSYYSAIPETGYYLAVGDNGTDSVIKSIDGGDTWNVVSNDLDNIQVREIAYSPTLDRLVAVSGRYERGNGGTPAQTSFIHTSDDDGVTWTQRLTLGGFASSQFQSVEWIESLSKFFAVAWGQGRIYSSTDGISWSYITNTTGVNFTERTKVRWSDNQNQIVISQFGRSPVLYSATGSTWALSGIGEDTGSQWQGTTDLGTFSIAVNDQGNLNDGTTRWLGSQNWTPSGYGTNPIGQSFYDITSSDTIAIAPGNNNIIYRTTGFVNTPITVGAGSQTWRSVCYNSVNDTFIAVAQNGTDRVAKSSDDGLTWNTINVQTNSYYTVKWINKNI